MKIFYGKAFSILAGCSLTILSNQLKAEDFAPIISCQLNKNTDELKMITVNYIKKIYRADLVFEKSSQTNIKVDFTSLLKANVNTDEEYGIHFLAMAMDLGTYHRLNYVVIDLPEIKQTENMEKEVAEPSDNQIVLIEAFDNKSTKIGTKVLFRDESLGDCY